jgi:O-acetyl-ADP-ribose deacetylase (regulator of RNase III)
MSLIEVIEADITTLQVDAIVKAANETPSGGGGRADALAQVQQTRAPRRAPKARGRRPGCLASNGLRALQRRDASADRQ